MQAIEKSYTVAASQSEADYWNSIQEESDEDFDKEIEESFDFEDDEQLPDHFEEDYYDDVG